MLTMELFQLIMEFGYDCRKLLDHRLMPPTTQPSTSHKPPHHCSSDNSQDNPYHHSDHHSSHHLGLGLTESDNISRGIFSQVL